MKKILLTILIIITIFSINILAVVDIDVGCEAIDRGSQRDTGTHINKTNPANETGTITSVEIFARAAMTDVKVAIFFVVSGDNLSTRDYVYIGDMSIGYHQFDVNLDVEAGDYIGIYHSGYIESGTSGGDGIWYYSDNDMIPCTNQAFSYYPSYLISLYGTGTTAVGWDHKWNTQTISKWNTKEFTKWNGLE